MAGLAGCATVPPQLVQVPVPVACQVAEPAPPERPTAALRPGDPLDRVLQLGLAELERVNAYAEALLLALRACTVMTAAH